MLADLLNDKDKLTCILLEDTVQQSASCVFKAIITAVGQFSDVVICISYDVTSEELLKSLPPAVREKIVIHDGYSDPVGWRELPDKVHIDTDLATLISNHHKVSDLKVTIAVSGLSRLILSSSTTHICQILARLKTKLLRDVQRLRLIGHLHSDAVDDVTVRALRHCFSSLVRVLPSGRPGQPFLCRTRHCRRRSNKVVTNLLRLNVTADMEFDRVEQVNDAIPIQEEQQKIDPAANLTFNLNLRDSEKEARSRVVLPYMEKQTSAEIAPQGDGGGAIYYQPDEFDDWDEEDPDDDLNI